MTDSDNGIAIFSMILAAVMVGAFFIGGWLLMAYLADWSSGADPIVASHAVAVGLALILASIVLGFVLFLVEGDAMKLLWRRLRDWWGAVYIERIRRQPLQTWIVQRIRGLR